MSTPAAEAPGTAVAVSPPSDRRVMVSAVTVTLMGSLPVWMVGALAVQIGRDIELGPARLGLASGAFFGAAALGSAQMGRIAERIGPRWAGRLGAVLSATVQAGIASSRSYPMLIGALAAAGLSNALSQVGANLLIARGVPARRQGWALAVKQAGVPAGTLLGGLAVPAFGVTVGWRWAFVVGSASSMAIAAAVPAVAGGPVRRRGERASLDVPVTLLLPLAVAVAFAAMANGTLATFLVSAGVHAGLGESVAGLVLTMGSAVGISMRLVAGARADRRGGRHLPVVSMLLVGGSLGYLLLAPGAVATHLIGAVLAFGSGWAWPGLFNLAVVRLNPSAPAAATGITQTGVYTGALIGPVLFGLLVDAYGYGWAWAAAAVSSSGAAVAILAARRRIIRWRERATAPA